MHFADAKYATLLALTGEVSGHITDLENLWLSQLVGFEGATNDLWYYHLRNGYGLRGHINDMFHAYLLLEGGTEGLALADLWYEFWLNGGPTLEYENLLLNSSFAGVSGSVSGGDWVDPTDWNNTFWPPDEAATVDFGTHIGIRFASSVAGSGRGFIQQQTDVIGSGNVGKVYNMSYYLESAELPSANRGFTVSGSGNDIQSEPERCSPPLGRKSGTFIITEDVDPIVRYRFGTGTTDIIETDFVISRPQVTEGEQLLPYKAT